MYVKCVLGPACEAGYNALPKSICHACQIRRNTLANTRRWLWIDKCSIPYDLLVLVCFHSLGTKVEPTRIGKLAGPVRRCMCAWGFAKPNFNALRLNGAWQVSKPQQSNQRVNHKALILMQLIAPPLGSCPKPIKSASHANTYMWLEHLRHATKPTEALTLLNKILRPPWL